MTPIKISFFINVVFPTKFTVFVRYKIEVTQMQTCLHYVITQKQSREGPEGGGTRYFVPCRIHESVVIFDSSFCGRNKCSMIISRKQGGDEYVIRSAVRVHEGIGE